MRLTVVDGGVEHDLYADAVRHRPPTSDEFRQPFYLIANLAIGGAFTDAYRLAIRGSGLPVTMPLPATMYVDYVRVYQWNGQGEVTLGPPTPQGGTLRALHRHDADQRRPRDRRRPRTIYVWESTLVDGTIPPYEGSQRPVVADQRQGLVRRRHHVASSR